MAHAISRRNHKKSRAGCVRCKRRHVKCDESRPICVNCSVAGLDCEYLTVPGNARTAVSANVGFSKDSGAGRSAGSPASAGFMTAQTSPASLNPAALTPTLRPVYGTDAVLNLDHMELLHHFCTETYKTLSPDEDQQETWQRVAVKHGLSFPFLLHQVFAISALHLAYLTPNRQSHYSTKAMEMQSHALDGFRGMQDKIESSSCGAIMLFSSLLALHVLADRSQTQNLPPSEYLDHLINCLNLMHSVRKVVITDWLPRIAELDLKPLLQVSQPEKPYNIPPECRELEQLPRTSDLGPASVTAYDAAIERLQWMFALADVPATTHSTIRWLLAWPLQLSDDYMKLLHERRPEALIILAYYGVVLHAYRESWAVGDSGTTLIRAINSHIGSYWARWMAWPLRMVGGVT